MTQNVVKFPESARSSSTGRSNCDDGNDDVVVVGLVENCSMDMVGSWAKRAPSRQAKKSMMRGCDEERERVARLDAKKQGSNDILISQ